MVEKGHFQLLFRGPRCPFTGPVRTRTNVFRWPCSDPHQSRSSSDGKGIGESKIEFGC